MKTLSLIFSLALLSGVIGCQKNEIDPIDVIPQLPNGQYTGRITYITYVWTGKEDTLYREATTNINFKLDGNKFHRPECGDCNGTIAVDAISHAATFRSSDKACIDKGTSANGGWSYINGIMGDYIYSLSDNELTLTQEYPRPKDIGAGSAYYTKKIIVATRQPLQKGPN